VFDRPKLPRNREVRACLPCRNGKLKCDRSKPRCQRCCTNNRDCVFVPRLSEGADKSISLEREPDVGRTAGNLPKPLYNQPKDQTIWLNQAGLLKASEGTQLRYYASSSWISSLVDPPEELQTQEPWTTIPAEESPQDPSTSPHSSSINSANPDPSIYDFASVDEVNKVVCYFTEYGQFFYPVVDIQAVTGALHQHAKSQMNLPPEISALVAAICFWASSTLNMSGQVDPSNTEPPFWKDLAHRFLFASGYPLRPNLDNLRAAFLLSASSMTEWDLLPDPTPISVLVRTAQSLGLHRDPASFQCSPREANFRRRIWWSILALDVSYSLAHALPPLILRGTFDVQMIDCETDPELKCLTSICRVNIRFSRILEEIYGIRKPSVHVFQELDHDTGELRKELIQKPEGVSAQDKFIALSRNMCCAKMIFILHQPYLRSALWPKESRTKALESAVCYIKDYATAMTEPSLSQYRWILSHWSMYHALAIILQDLIQYPNSPESATLRELIDSTFEEFSRPDDHNWKRLQCLRLRAWIANEWSSADASKYEKADRNVSLSDWDPLFASFLWDFASPSTSGSGV
jgi:hypothetical protein